MRLSTEKWTSPQPTRERLRNLNFTADGETPVCVGRLATGRGDGLRSKCIKALEGLGRASPLARRPWKAVVRILGQSLVSTSRSDLLSACSTLSIGTHLLRALAGRTSVAPEGTASIAKFFFASSRELFGHRLPPSCRREKRATVLVCRGGQVQLLGERLAHRTGCFTENWTRPAALSTGCWDVKQRFVLSLPRPLSIPAPRFSFSASPAKPGTCRLPELFP